MFRWLWSTIERQTRQFGTKLMGLYLILLLIPVSGIGLYGHSYIRQALSQYILQSKLNEIRVQATTIDLLLSQVHQDILQLDHLLPTISDVDHGLDGFVSAHPLYKRVVWLDENHTLIAGDYTPVLQTWMNENSAFTGGLPYNSLRIVPLPYTDNTVSLIAVAHMSRDYLLIEIDANYLLQGISSDAPPEEAWSLWIAPDTMLTTATTNPLAGTQLNQLTEETSYIPDGEQLHLYNKIGPGREWALVESIPRNFIQPDMSSYYTTFSILLIGGWYLWWFALFAIARIIEPVYQLSQRVERIRHGETPPPFSTPLPTDEFGDLMVAFDQMAVELEQQRRIERELVERLITAQEEERKIIAYDLHDGLIQKLVGARFYLRGCKQDNQQELVQGYEVLTGAITEGRRIIQGLHPTVLDDLGLEAALEECANSMAQMAGWQAHIDLVTLEKQPDRVTNVTLYRIAQEAMNNAFKHANATQVWLTLDCREGHLCLSVQDNGCGFDVDEILQRSGNGWGLRTMRERTNMLHGSHTVISSPQSGTRIQVTIPHDC